MSDALDRIVVEDKGELYPGWRAGKEVGCCWGAIDGEGSGMLMRLVFTAGKGIYRHDAEGSDDMPVRARRVSKY